MYFHFFDTMGPEKIRRLISDYKPMDDLPGMFDLSMGAIRDAIDKPVGSWQPGKYQGPENKEVKYSVYSYETYDGPERYDFGFRRGIIPWFAGLFSNSRILNELGMRMSDKVSTWRFIKPVLEIAKKRRRSGMNMTAFLICEMDAGDEPGLEDLIELTARRFKLEGRTHDGI